MIKKSYKRVLAIGMAAALLAGLVGCGSNTANSGTVAADTENVTSKATESVQDQSEESEAAEGDAAESKELVVGWSSSPSYFDPVNSGTTTTNVLRELYYPLFYFDENGKLQNASCESYTVSEDGLVYTFKLIENYWSDGEKVKASDFEYGIKRVLSYGADADYPYYIYNYVVGAKEAFDQGLSVAEQTEVGIKALDDDTLEITLEKPCAYFVQLTAYNVYFPVRADFAPEHDESWSFNPETPFNGPFYLESVNEKEEVVLVKNPYFADADKINLDKLTLKIISDAQSQLLAFQNGSIDVALDPPSDTVLTYSGDQAEIQIPKAAFNYYLTFNVSEDSENAVLSENVRKAVSIGINRQQIVEALDGGNAYIALYGIVPSGISGPNGEDFRTEAGDLIVEDKEEAKALLEAEGYTQDNPLTLYYPYSSNTRNTTVAEILQAQLAEINVNLEIEALESQALSTKKGSLDFNLYRYAMGPDYMDPQTLLDYFNSTNQSPVYLNDSDINTWLDSATVELDENERNELLHNVENKLIEQENYVVPIFAFNNAHLVKTNVSGIEWYPDGGYVFWYADIN